MRKILSVVGARPQFIKASIVSRRLRELKANQLLLHTGQHYDFKMSGIFFNELGIKEPDYQLEIGSGNHGEQTGSMLIEIEKVLIQTKPDLVIVYGDTNTTLAGALAASKLKIPLAHIEAGLRSYNKNMPEEINRVLTDHVSDLLFTPTLTAVENLKKEGIVEDVFNVGDVMFDLAVEVFNKMNNCVDEILGKYNIFENEFVLATVHRVDNTDIRNNLINIFEAFKIIANSGIKVFFPVHPRTRRYLEAYNILNQESQNNLIINEPVAYSEMLVLEKCAKVVITDSGGVQKESYFFKTPAVIPREETEWVEIVESGWNILTGANKEKIVKNTLKLYKTGLNREWKNFYGDGNASYIISEIIKNFGGTSSNK